MKLRLLTALGILVFGLPLLIFSDYIVYPIALGVLSAIACCELLHAFGLLRKLYLTIPTCIMAFALPFCANNVFNKYIISTHNQNYLLIMALVVFSYLLYLVATAVISSGGISFGQVARVFMSVVYVVVSFSSMAIIRYMNYGQFFFELMFVGAWMCDTFAYFTGRLFGKHKLCPKLSPKKTVEGAIGGLIFNIGGCMLYGLIIELITKHIDGLVELDANYITLAVIGLVLGIVSMIGDLWASLIKRECGIKDYSKILPGHGGILDRFDSVLAVATVLMVICMFFPPFREVVTAVQ